MSKATKAELEAMLKRCMELLILVEVSGRCPYCHSDFLEEDHSDDCELNDILDWGLENGIISFEGEGVDNNEQ